MSEAVMAAVAGLSALAPSAAPVATGSLSTSTAKRPVEAAEHSAGPAGPLPTPDGRKKVGDTALPPTVGTPRFGIRRATSFFRRPADLPADLPTRSGLP